MTRKHVTTTAAKSGAFKILRVSLLANHQMAVAGWAVNQMPPDDCLGFTVRIINEDGTKTECPTRFVFEGENNKKWEKFTTAQKPVQRFIWRLLSLPQGWTGRVEVAPVFGTPENPTVDESLAVQSGPATLTATAAGGLMEAFFNRGYPSMQALMRMCPRTDDGKVDVAALKTRLGTDGDPIRDLMANGIDKVLQQFSRDVLEQENLSLLAALYECTDEPSVKLFEQCGELLEIVLANIEGKNDAAGENDGTHERLVKAGCKMHFRKVPSGSIAHNKTQVLRKKLQKVVKAIKSVVGSCNDTKNGVAGQWNQMVRINIPEVAEIIADYIQRLIKDTDENDGKQGPELRDANDKAYVVWVDGGRTKISLFFSPNSPRTGKTQPKGLAYTEGKFKRVKRSILGVVFQPGKKSVVDFFEDAVKSKPYIVGRYAVSSPQALPEDAVALYKRSHVPVIVQASSVKLASDVFIAELQKLGFAIIHGKCYTLDHDTNAEEIEALDLSKEPVKVEVVDNPDPNEGTREMDLDDPNYCVTGFGTDNLGDRAKRYNDEVHVIVEGTGPLARTLSRMFAVALYDVFDHNQERWLASVHEMHPVDMGMLKRDSSWCDKDYLVEGSQRNREMLLWAGLPLPGNDVVPAEEK
jgi:phosphatidylserine/phosphatidylglycerophosphate/cardiolipin synthase-like enzyme